MNIAIVGGRNFKNYIKMKKYIEDNLNVSQIDNIVSGGAKGADSLGRRFAEEHNISMITHLPDWDRYGKSAGFKRNPLIVADADTVIAFWDGKSKGTKDTITLAREAGKFVQVVIYTDANKEDGE